MWVLGLVVTLSLLLRVPHDVTTAKEVRRLAVTSEHHIRRELGVQATSGRGQRSILSSATHSHVDDVALVTTSLSQWINSTSNVHAFLSFDYTISPDQITPESASKYDYVRGASRSTLPNFTAASSGTIYSAYMPFNRDFTAQSLAWWKAHHPDMIMYKCDRTTPAYECFPGESCPYGPVPLTPLDVSLPKTLAWQVTHRMLPALKLGYQAVDLDNYCLDNPFAACGSYSGANGSWVQKYTGEYVDAAWERDVLDWTRRLQLVARGLGMLVIPNFQISRAWNDTGVLAVGNFTDGILDEGGFVYWGPDNQWNWTGQASMNAAAYENRLRFVRNLQRQGKAYYMINEWGPGTDYNMNPAEVPFNISGIENRWIRQYVVATYLLIRGDACAVYLVCSQCYGNWSWWPEYSEARVGAPTDDEPRRVASLDGQWVWTRRYANGVVFVNPESVDVARAPATIRLDRSLRDLYGRVYAEGSVLSLNATNGIVLLFRD